MKQLCLALLFLFVNVGAMDLASAEQFKGDYFVLEVQNEYHFKRQLSEALTFLQHLLESKNDIPHDVMNDEQKEQLANMYEYVLGMLTYYTVKNLQGPHLEVSCDVRLKNIIDKYFIMNKDYWRITFVDSAGNIPMLSMVPVEQFIDFDEIEYAHNTLRRFRTPDAVLQFYCYLYWKVGLPQDILEIINKFVHQNILQERVKHVAFPNWIADGVVEGKKKIFCYLHDTRVRYVLSFYDKSAINYDNKLNNISDSFADVRPRFFFENLKSLLVFSEEGSRSDWLRYYPGATRW